MNYLEVAPLRAVRGTQQAYTYQTETTLAVGQLVTIPLGKEEHLGLVVATSKKPTYDTKPISDVLELPPLPLPLVKTTLWMSEYYATHFATVLQTALPRGLTKKRRSSDHEVIQHAVRDRTHFLLNDQQTTAIASLRDVGTGTVLLHGITGSGKTAVYIEHI